MEEGKHLRRVATGIVGLDELIEGGFPEGTVNLISGPTGSGKSLFALQYLYKGALLYKEPGIYITIEEGRESSLKAATRVGMDLRPLEEEKKLLIVDIGEFRTAPETKEELDIKLVSLSHIRNLLDKQLSVGKAKRVVIDSITAVCLSYTNISELRRELFRFCKFLRSTGTTSLLTSETLRNADISPFGVEEFLTDSYIGLGLERIKGDLRRTITIRKMRFTKHDISTHPFLITDKGVTVGAKEKIIE